MSEVEVVDFSDDVLQPVILVWSEKYCSPVYKVAGKMYMPATEEDAGYYSEVVETTSDHLKEKRQDDENT